MSTRSMALLICLLTAPTVSAQGLGSDAPSVARERYDIGRQLYRKGDYAGAAREFRVAFRLHPTSARLAYNLARSLERSQQVAPAIEAYAAYLRLAPEATDRGQVLEVVAALRELLPEDKPGPEPEPEPELTTRSAWPWVAFGVGAVGLGAGTWFLVATGHATAERDAAIDGGLGRAEVESHQDDATFDEKLAIAGFSVAVLGIATGGLLYWLDAREAGDAALHVGARPGGLVVGGTW